MRLLEFISYSLTESNRIDTLSLGYRAPQPNELPHFLLREDFTVNRLWRAVQWAPPPPSAPSRICKQLKLMFTAAKTTNHLGGFLLCAVDGVFDFAGEPRIRASLFSILFIKVSLPRESSVLIHNSNCLSRPCTALTCSVISACCWWQKTELCEIDRLRSLIKGIYRWLQRGLSAKRAAKRIPLSSMMRLPPFFPLEI